jgi:hypothetical protein
MRFRVLGSGAIELVRAYRGSGPQSGTPTTVLAAATPSDIISFCFPKKEPHDGTHHAAPKTAPIAYAMPSVASVGSSITDVTANPLSAWKAAIASRVIGPSTPSIAPS